MTNQDITSNREAENIANEAQQDASFQKMLKFKKGDYWCDNEEVALGTVYLVHAKAWAKTWIHFENKQVVERKVYRVALGERAPERDQIPNNDQETWPKDPNGKPQDPWALQYLLPFENMETGDVQIFVAQSFGGRRAVGDLCTQWAKRAGRNPKSGQPIVKIGVTTFPTKNWGDVKAPKFEIIGWDDTVTGQAVKTVDMTKVDSSKAQFDDEIPF
jgi:hypothetical protein